MEHAKRYSSFNFSINILNINLLKRWHWWDPNTHVHAPPNQPIIFALNKFIYVKVYTQSRVYINFYAESKSCKFRVGSNLMVSMKNSKILISILKLYFSFGLACKA